MATIALGALGTLVGGPIGGAIGALLGRQVDSAIIGNGSREGPRLNDLTVTTSSYGSPIPRHFGRMRTAGTIIWATDLAENRETSGGKGKPKTTTYSYTTSFAVALSSRPISRIGRIWADGDLLRGAAGDLKVGGSIRVYEGYGDQPVDPLIAAAQGSTCPAFRGSAYVVFEDLQLEDFGNRIPALSFEVFADEIAFSLGDIVEPLASRSSASVALDSLTGFSYERGTLIDTIETLKALFPTATITDTETETGGVLLQPAVNHSDTALVLPEPVPSTDGENTRQTDGVIRERQTAKAPAPSAIRYYDTARDYQPGVQRPEGRVLRADSTTLEFPGALPPDAARNLVNRASINQQKSSERMRWRVAELDPALFPGKLVSAPGIAGTWIVSSWEWQDRGIELVLDRPPIASVAVSLGDTGNPSLLPDILPSETWLRAFELPWDGVGSPDDARVFAGLSSATPAWSGASLYLANDMLDTAAPLTPIGPSGRGRAIMGRLAAALPPSHAILFEPNGFLEISTESDDMMFASTTIEALANGGNRLLVGDEIVQFANAIRIEPSRWLLAGLLRGRGGSEHTAMAGHESGAAVTLIDDTLVAIDSASSLLPQTTAIAAIGRGDDEPVTSVISNRGVSLRPLAPVHPREETKPDGDLLLCWSRRARGAWRWLDEVETPLIEAVESYRVGIGAIEAPDMLWDIFQPQITLTSAQVASHSGKTVWVRQAGRESYSPALALSTLP